MSIIVIKNRGVGVDAVNAFSDKANLISKEVAKALRKRNRIEIECLSMSECAFYHFEYVMFITINIFHVFCVCCWCLFKCVKHFQL